MTAHSKHFAAINPLTNGPNRVVMLGLMGETVRFVSTDVDLRAACDASMVPYVPRCPTLYQRALDVASEYTPEPTARDAALALVLLGDRFDQPVAYVLCDEPEPFVLAVCAAWGIEVRNA